MGELDLLLDLHKGASCQGPGGDRETEQAIALAGLNREKPLNIADIGCGTGAAALVLARLLNARITAVDFLQEFLVGHRVVWRITVRLVPGIDFSL